jgi:hypothetical protein
LPTTKRKTPVVETTPIAENNGMNLFLALIWLIGAVVLLAYEHYLGESPFRIRAGDTNFSAAWLMLVLGIYNLVRWWSLRSYRMEQRAQELAQAKREWERRRRSSEPAGPPDPNFNFTDQPPPSNRGITDQPPSNN